MYKCFISCSTIPSHLIKVFMLVCIPVSLLFAMESDTKPVNEYGIVPSYTIDDSDNLKIGDGVLLKATLHNHGVRSVKLEIVIAKDAKKTMENGVFSINVYDEHGNPVRQNDVLTRDIRKQPARSSFEEGGGPLHSSPELYGTEYILEPGERLSLNRKIPLHCWFDLSISGKYRVEINHYIKVVNDSTIKYILLDGSTTNFEIRE